MRLRVWLRAVRIRFLLSSVIAVSIGGAASWSVHARIDPLDLLLVGAGVAALHASVDLLNDYRDYKRGIDKAAPRTGMSGGSGVLPEGLLEPRSVYRAGMACLACGSAVGSYYVYLHGITIGLILGFAVLSIYFYSTRIVDWGLGELFVGIKGGLIVCGSYYIQSGGLDGTALFAGAAAGSLSAFVLFMTSFPDHDADRGGGRRTLVIRLGPGRAARLYFAFPAAFAAAILAGITLGQFPAHCLVSLAALPLGILAGRGLERDCAMPRAQMRRALLFSRISGAALAAGFAAPPIISISGAA